MSVSQVAKNNFDVIIIGAGAAGLMCAIEAGKRGRRVLILDHANKVGKKILMSGGGRCNFTNYNIGPDKYISHNPHFFKSALSRYTQWDFIELINKHAISFHEKKEGQLFCDHKAKDILNMLLSECEAVNVSIKIDEKINIIENNPFKIITNKDEYCCESLVIATGGLSIPTLGATPFGYKVAEQFGIKVWPTRAGLVPLTLKENDLSKFSVLAGISNDSIVTCGKKSFRENILFTHRGLSGPAILQISNYWKAGDKLEINLMPDVIQGKQLAKRLVNVFLDSTIENCEKITQQFQSWSIYPNGTEGYRTAEVTLGGVDCDAVSSKTMEAYDFKGLFFIGEVLDVTGWLGGYNFQWAWSSGWAAGQVV